MVDSLEGYLPETFGHYFEPFCGGAALFFGLKPSEATLSDVNSELIECYRTVSADPEAVILASESLKNTKSEYYRIRDSRPSTASERAARFLYLNRLAFNGIHRVNLKGDFNVPYGHKTHLSSHDPELIRKASKTLQKATIEKRSFEMVSLYAKPGDVVYFDPPYTLAHSNNGFIKYNQTLFSWSDQRNLANVAELLRRRRCYVVVSNATHPSISALYRNFAELLVDRHSVIAANPLDRKPVTESLFLGW